MKRIGFIFGIIIGFFRVSDSYAQEKKVGINETVRVEDTGPALDSAVLDKDQDFIDTGNNNKKSHSKAYKKNTLTGNIRNRNSLNNKGKSSDSTSDSVNTDIESMEGLGTNSSSNTVNTQTGMP